MHVRVCAGAGTDTQDWSSADDLSWRTGTGDIHYSVYFRV